MEIQIIAFGKISDIITDQNLELSGINDTDELKVYLEIRFSALSGVKYKLALNKKIVQSKQELTDQDTLVLMSPFSGG